MKNKEFMEQKASEMSVEELAEAIKIKQKDMKLTFAQEIKKYPSRFERLIGNGWVPVLRGYGVSINGNARIINSNWNSYGLSNVYYVEFTYGASVFKEIIRRKK